MEHQLKQNKIIFLCVFVLALSFISEGWAKQSDFIYRQRSRWVKLEKANPKLVPLGSLQHPYTGLSAKQMEAMLLSIKINKSSVFKKVVNEVDIFNTYEARQYSQYIVEALSQADPDHVVNIAVVHKRPLWVMQNDLLTLANIWVDAEGLHIQFRKLFAKLTGDYDVAHNVDKAFKRAKSLRVTLEAGPGQSLSYQSPMEIILDPKHNFIQEVSQQKQERLAQEEEDMHGSGSVKSKKSKKAAATDSESSFSGGKSVAQRLKELDELKRQGLITQQEHANLRKKILEEL